MTGSEKKNTNKTLLSNLIWRYAERCGAQAVGFIITIVLARLLDPNAYGIIALITVFTTILQVFVDSGLGNALIQKMNADDLDFSTVFYTNIVFCTLLYIIIYALSPTIADFYNAPEMIPMIRVLSLTVVISGVKNVQQAYVSRHMIFKRFFFSTLGGTLVAAAIGIAMAYMGYGVWALVMQQVINLAVDTLILWITVKWRPKAVFSFKRLKTLYSFGWKLLISSILDTVYNDIRQLIIGKLYSSLDLAFYNKAKQFPNLIIGNINASIDSVLLPAMSSAQDERERVRSMTRRSIKTSVYIMAPFMMGMAFIAEPLISFLLTDKWLPCVPFLRVFCITSMFMPIHTANLNAIKAMGRSDLFLKLEILKKIMGVIVLVTVMWHGVMALTYSMLFTSVMSQIINSWPNRKLLDYSYIDQLKDIIPGIMLAVVMGACVYPIKFLNIPTIAIIALQVIAGSGIYIVGSALLKLETFDYLWSIIRSFTKKKMV